MMRHWSQIDRNQIQFSDIEFNVQQEGISDNSVQSTQLEQLHAIQNLSQTVQLESCNNNGAPNMAQRNVKRKAQISPEQLQDNTEMNKGQLNKYLKEKKLNITQIENLPVELLIFYNRKNGRPDKEMKRKYALIKKYAEDMDMI